MSGDTRARTATATAARGTENRGIFDDPAKVFAAGGVPTAAATPAALAARRRAHALVLAVDRLLTQYVSDVDSKAVQWHEVEAPFVIGTRCRAAQSTVRRMEAILRTEAPVPADGWAAALGAFVLAQRYLARLVTPEGATRVSAARRALEQAAALAPPEPKPKPLTVGWHVVADDSGALVGYVNVKNASLIELYDADLAWIDAIETPIVSEGLGPIDYLPIAWGLGRLGYQLGGRLAAAMLRRLATVSTRRFAQRSVFIAGTLKGAGQAVPVIAGEQAAHVWIMSEALTAQAVRTQASAAARTIAAEEGITEIAAAEATVGKTGVPRPGIGAGSTSTGATATTQSAGTAAAATAGATAVRPGSSLGKEAEAPVLQAYHPNALSAPENFRAYDAYEGGTAQYFITRERYKNGWILVVNKVVSGARWISLKRVLEHADATPENIRKHVDNAMRDMERDANDRSARKPARDPDPIDPNTHERVIKEHPAGVTLHITYPGPVTAETAAALEQAARAAARNSGRIEDLPNFELMLNGRRIPLD
ncbi:hypothetical protein [Nocardia brasiliensis]|uniref:hypothetical protein n=1 Tax=Nocardia brasiliensis TaxID=37326 RepID=UPI001894D4C5|nr:hypothetical protein [Nocardia brasiliensis]MBF6542597.1 hypothetical protein [Nocardia brasiliensis]